MTDKIIRGVDSSGSFRFAVASSTEMVDEMASIHGTSATATAALGRLLTMAAILGTDMKSDQDALTLTVKGDGPAGMLTAVADTDGRVRGYVEHPFVDLPVRPEGKLDVGGLVGKNGTLAIIRDFGLKEPYVGYSDLVSGEIAEDFANYFFTSEQTPTVVSLGVLVEVDLTCRAAGGLMIQALPGVSDEALTKLEKALENLPSITNMIDSGLTPETILSTYFSDFEVEILDEGTLKYECNCSRERIENALRGLSNVELQQMIDEDHGAEVVCHFCNSTYQFSEEDLKTLIKSEN